MNEKLKDALDNLGDEVRAYSPEENAGREMADEYIGDFLTVADARLILSALSPREQPEPVAWPSQDAIEQEIYEAFGLGHHSDAANDAAARVFALYAQPSEQTGGGGVEEVDDLSCISLAREPNSLDLLDRWDDNWVIARGRTRPDEPLFGVQLLIDEEVVAEGEAETLSEAILAALTTPEVVKP